jgi:hypothetical protein
MSYGCVIDEPKEIWSTLIRVRRIAHRLFVQGLQTAAHRDRLDIRTYRYWQYHSQYRRSLET